MTGLLVALLFFQQPDVRPSFSDFLAGIRTEALARGIRKEIVDEALTNIEEPLPVVIERDRAQAEVVQSFESYIARHVSVKMIHTGRERLERQRALLDEISATYGVPPRVIVAIWGLETNYGRFGGTRPTIAALATLAWDPRRSAFFRLELFDALEILNRGDIDAGHMRGSWAGAMGQVQFMPSSYLQYAEDYNGDGRRDIWSTPADVFASIANYLKGHGWTPGQTWGREVSVPPAAAKSIGRDVARREGSCKAMRDMTVALPLSKWSSLGVRLPGARPLPKSDLTASLVSGSKRSFLVYSNYDAILDYNCAHSYALSVGLLGDAIAAGSATAPAPKPARPARRRRAN